MKGTVGYKQGKGKKAHVRNEAGVGVGPGRLCQIAPVGPEKQGGEVPCASLRKGGRSERVRKKGAGEDVFKLGLVAVVRQDASGKAVVVGQGKGVCHIVEQHPQAKGVPRGMHAPPAQAGRQAGDGRQRAGKVVSAGKALGKRAAQVGQQIEVRLDAAQQKGAAMAQGEPWPLPQQQLSKLKVIFGSQVHRPLSMLAPVAPCSFQYGQEEGKK